MSTETKQEVETTVQTASTEQTAAENAGVKTNESLAPEIDLAAEYEALLKENERINSEKENYKRGILKAKGKLPEEEELDESEDERIDRKVREQILSIREIETKQKEQEVIKKLIRQNKELKLTAQNRAQVSSASSGSSGEGKPESKQEYFTSEQLAYFKKRGINPETVKANLNKYKEK